MSWDWRNQSHKVPTAVVADVSDSQFPIELDDVTLVKSTDKAILIRTEDGTEVWIPRSCVLDGTEITKEGDVGGLIVPSWLIDRAGLA